MTNEGKTNLDKLTIFTGLEDIQFGMTEGEVTAILGNSYEREIDDGDFSIIYDNLGIEFTFWGDEDNRLGMIESERPKLSLDGTELYAKSKDEIRDFITDKLNETITREDSGTATDGNEYSWIDVDGSSLSFWFTKCRLSSIVLTVEWLDDETPRWPR